MGKTKKARREQAIKKAKQKKMIVKIAVVIVAIAAVASIISAVSSTVRAKGNREDAVYSDGSAIIELYQDGTFNARLYHHETYSGTYAKTANRISFRHDGVTVRGVLNGGNLSLPQEWKDSCNHGTILPRISDAMD